ncbi:MAG: N-acetyl-gamma-glutamyl-phosphate reductase [Candidatus Rokubacteria bacterium]|nr:N-acetyl-gamma-glutamyl-phosphate reductase [Candidatus Rokubacteria bacterium]
MSYDIAYPTAAGAGASGAAWAPPCRVGVLGATGYSGAELIRLLSGHPGVRLEAASSRQDAGRPLASVLPSLPEADVILDDDPERPDAWIDRGVGVVFSALPHGAFATRARAFLDAGLRIIDLSSDFRLRDAGDYRRRYGMEHPDPDLLGDAVYGLSEWRGEAVSGAALVANPGCYATAILLGLLPAVEAGLVGREPIVVNAVSGVSGAGRAPSLTTHFVERDGSVSPYRVGEEHPHLGEVGQTLAEAGLAPLPLVFNPHLAPMVRGILASAVLKLRFPLEPERARAIYAERYAGHPFVRVLDGGLLPETRHVRGSNRCDIAVRTSAEGQLLMVFSAIDNLIKGAAGQAIQNLNRMMGWTEETGLPRTGWGSA